MLTADVLAIQLYTLREVGDVDSVLDAAAAAGFRYVETIGAHLDQADSLLRKLDARGLEAASSHVGLAQLRDQPDAMIAAAESLGITELYMPAVPPEDRDMDAAGWRALGTELAEIAEDFQTAGIRLGYHNHDWELTPKEGDKTALELLFEGAGSGPLTWQADVAWLARGKADPEAWLERYRDRLLSVHVKDIAPDGENQDQDGWADVGHGILDWRALWETCRANGAGWMIVEHDKPASPESSARRSRQFLLDMPL